MAKEKCGADCGDDCPLKNGKKTLKIIGNVEDLNDSEKLRELEANGVKPCKGCVGKVLENAQKGVDMVLSEIE